MLSKAMLIQVRLNSGGVSGLYMENMQASTVAQKKLTLQLLLGHRELHIWASAWNCWQLENKHCQRHDDEIDARLHFAKSL